MLWLLTCSALLVGAIAAASEWQDGRPPTFDHGLVWRKSEGSAAVAALETATYVFMAEYPPARPHREQALMTDGRGKLLGQQF
jgi:hypothetical protein